MLIFVCLNFVCGKGEDFINLLNYISELLNICSLWYQTEIPAPQCYSQCKQALFYDSYCMLYSFMWCRTLCLKFNVNFSYDTVGGIDERVGTILSLCCEKEVQVVYAMSRRRLAAVLRKRFKMGCVGIFSYDGAEVRYCRKFDRNLHHMYMYMHMHMYFFKCLWFVNIYTYMYILALCNIRQAPKVNTIIC